MQGNDGLNKEKNNKGVILNKVGLRPRSIPNMGINPLVIRKYETKKTTWYKSNVYLGWKKQIRSCTLMEKGAIEKLTS